MTTISFLTFIKENRTKIYNIPYFYRNIISKIKSIRADEEMIEAFSWLYLESGNFYYYPLYFLININMPDNERIKVRKLYNLFKL